MLISFFVKTDLHTCHPYYITSFSAFLQNFSVDFRVEQVHLDPFDKKYVNLWYNESMLLNCILLITAYLLGSIPSGLWIGQVFFHKNIRDYGSGNIGTTNTFRVLGKQAGMAVFLLDFLKGSLAVLLPIWLQAEGVSPIVFGLLAVLGHTFPIFAQFKGGKAVATSAGMLMGFAPLFCLYLMLVFALTLYLTSMVSLSSIVGAILGMIGALVFPSTGFLIHGYDPVFTIIILFLGSFVIVRHKENIERILKKEENLLPWGLNLTEQQKKN